MTGPTRERGRAWCAVPGVGPGAEAVYVGLQGRGVCLAAWRPVLSVGLGCLEDDPGGL